MNSINASENIDNIAQSFFFVLIFCSLVSDSYIVFDNFLKNNYVKKKVGFFKKIYKITVELFCNNYEKDSDGNIIIHRLTENVNKKVKKNNTLINLKNPFDDIYKELEEIKEIVEDSIKEDSVKEDIDNEEHNNEEHNNEDDFKETIVKEIIVKEDKEINNIKIKEKKTKKNKKNINDDNYLIDKIKHKNIKEVIKKKN